VEVVPGASHFLPMERADLVRAALLDAAEAG
jgi:pimeloyl-ACP methyl ester carboxylesterase